MALLDQFMALRDGVTLKPPTNEWWKAAETGMTISTDEEHGLLMVLLHCHAAIFKPHPMRPHQGDPEPINDHDRPQGSGTMARPQAQ